MALVNKFWAKAPAKAAPKQQPAVYKSPGGNTVYSSGVVVGPATRAGDPTNYNAATNPGIGYDAYKAIALGSGGNQGAYGFAADVARGAANMPVGAQAQLAPAANRNLGTGSSGGASRRRSGGGGRRRGGGGGGGGGGVSAATTAAQNQINAITGLLGSSAYRFDPNDPRWQVDTSPYDTMRTNVAGATAQDQAAATGAYNALDAYLQNNQSNPYANVTMQHAARAPDMNPYLASQGVGALTPQGSNPEDTGYGAFQNILALLGASQQQAQQSRAAESQMARTYSGQQLGAMDNAFLANIGNQQTAAQQALNQQRLQAQQQIEQERRQASLQLMQLLATPGTTGPDLSALGIA